VRRPDLKRFLLLACLAGCRPSAERQAGEAGSLVALTAADSGRTVPVPVGIDNVITLATTPGTGYSWAIVDSGAPELQLVDTDRGSRLGAGNAAGGLYDRRLAVSCRARGKDGARIRLLAALGARETRRPAL